MVVNMKIIKEFKEFAMKGNIMDLAIGVIIGGAFSGIVTSFTENIIKPLITLFGGAEVHGTIVLAKNAAGEVTSAIDYGSFITAIINFLIIAFALFMLVKVINSADKRSKKRLEKLARKMGIDKTEEEAIEEAIEEPTTKVCPYCLSEIPYKAVKCSHCTSELSELEEEKEIEE